MAASLDSTNGTTLEIEGKRAEFLRHNYGIVPNRLLMSHENCYRLKQELRYSVFGSIEVEGMKFMDMKIMQTEDGPGIEVAYVWERQ